MGFELHDPQALIVNLCALPPETDWAEFKRNKFEAENVGKYVSGLANAAMFDGQQHAFMVWGIEDGTHGRRYVRQARRTEGWSGRIPILA